MKTLYLLRHAKSSWDDPLQSDHARPLNKHGRAAAPLIATWLASRGHVPDTVLCSSAARTRETVDRMRPALPGLPEPMVEEELYHASPDAMRGSQSFFCASVPPSRISSAAISDRVPSEPTPI